MNKAVLISVGAVLSAGVASLLVLRSPDDQGPADADAVLSAPASAASSHVAPTPPATTHAPGHQDIAPLTLAPGNLQEINQNQTGARDALVAPPSSQNSPEALARYRQTLRERYAGIGKTLDLSADELGRIVDMLVRWQADPASDTAQRQQTQEAELRAVLGSKYEAWEQHLAAFQARDAVSNLQNLFEISDIRLLSAAQTEALVATLAAEQVRIDHDNRGLRPQSAASNSPASTKEQLEWDLRNMPANNRRLVLAASRHLDQQQLEAYTTMLDNDFNRAIKARRAQIGNFATP